MGRPRWSTSYLVVSEAYSWVLHRYGEESGRTLAKFIDNLEGLGIFEVDHQHHQQVGRMLARLRGSKLTYVDASSLCFIERHKIRKVWSTDHHLGLTGVQVLPRR
jgi:predicted nucleic acid-binding protein